MHMNNIINRPKIEDLFSTRIAGMRSSEIRELLKLLDRPEMISFAGGLPNPDAFPIEKMKRVVSHVMEAHAREALQYGTTEGHAKLRQVICGGMQDHFGVPGLEMKDIMITNGSQQALNLLSQLFLNPGDCVLTSDPTYLGAILTFRSFQANIESVPLDEQGIRVDLLSERLRYLAKENKLPKFIYLIPSFQNPTGVTIPGENRREIYRLIEHYGVLLIEDDPYGLLRFEGEHVPLIKSMDNAERVIYLGTFSKILAPGYRIAWMIAAEEIIAKATIAKQAQDLCTNTFGQYCVFEAIYHDVLFPHVAEIIRLYKTKRDRMLAAMDRYFPKEVSYTRPQGGMFLWVTLPDGSDAFEMLKRSIEKNVAYVIGAPFFPNGGGHNTFRLNYSYASDDHIDEGIQRLAEVIKSQ
jgi:2-aminoadipate transaminase